jgi:hypothetical protein
VLGACASGRIGARSFEVVKLPVARWWCALPDGRRHGPYHELHPRGQVRIAGQFRGGLRDGVWTYWDQLGNLIRYEVLERDRAVRATRCRSR